MSYQQTQQQERRPIYCRNQCGIEITFDNRKSKSGKSIPIDKSSGMPHQCPRSMYNQHQRIGETKQPMKHVEEQATNQLLHEILFKIETLGEHMKKLADLYMERIEGLNA